MSVSVLKQTTEFRIEKGVPLPPHSGDGTRKYPFPQMEVGDSFPVPASRLSTIRAAATAYGIKHRWKFSVLKHEGGFRCWRIA